MLHFCCPLLLNSMGQMQKLYFPYGSVKSNINRSVWHVKVSHYVSNIYFSLVYLVLYLIYFSAAVALKCDDVMSFLNNLQFFSQLIVIVFLIHIFKEGLF